MMTRLPTGRTWYLRCFMPTGRPPIPPWVDFLPLISFLVEASVCLVITSFPRLGRSPCWTIRPPFCSASDSLRMLFPRCERNPPPWRFACFPSYAVWSGRSGLGSGLKIRCWIPSGFCTSMERTLYHQGLPG